MCLLDRPAVLYDLDVDGFVTVQLLAHLGHLVGAPRRHLMAAFLRRVAGPGSLRLGCHFTCHHGRVGEPRYLGLLAALPFLQPRVSVKVRLDHRVHVPLPLLFFFDFLRLPLEIEI